MKYFIFLVFICAGFWGSAVSAAKMSFTDGLGSLAEVNLPAGVNGQSIAIGDLGRDGVSEVVIGAAPGATSTVWVLRRDGSVISSFVAFPTKMVAGVNVAIGDLDGDGLAEIIVSTKAGFAGEVKVFDASGTEKVKFFPYGPSYFGGINLGVSDTDGNGNAEILTAPDDLSNKNVAMWAVNGRKLSEFTPFVSAKNGFYVAGGDANGDGKDEIFVIEKGYGNTALVFVGPKFDQKISLNLGYHNVSGFAISRGLGVKNELMIFEPELLSSSGGNKLWSFNLNSSYKNNFSAGQSGDLDAIGFFVDAGAAKLEYLTLVGNVDLRVDRSAQYILVNLANQTLTVFENGKPKRAFLVATGLRAFPTPVGKFKVLAKPYKVWYKRSYGLNNPNNYDFGLVPWNLKVTNSGIYIHYAPWRKVFGLRGSHGCINVDLQNAMWMYNWGSVGTTVAIN